MTGAERAGFLGAILLAGGLVAAAILVAGAAGGPAATGTAAGGGPPHPPPAPEPEESRPAPTTRVAALQAEVQRLRVELDRARKEISDLKARMREEGVEPESAPADPAAAAEELITRLRACGSETSPLEIEGLVGRLAGLGEGAVKTIRTHLDAGLDVAYTDAWLLAGSRFSAYPSFRVALLDALRRIDGVEGQSALLFSLRRSDAPLEICVLTRFLFDLRKVGAVEEVLLEAAKRYLDLPPPRREALIVGPVLDILSWLAPQDAAEAYHRFLATRDRSVQASELAVRRLAGLPEEVALPALARAGGMAELGPAAGAAGRALAERPGKAVAGALRSLLATASPPVRRDVYLSLTRPLQSALDRLPEKSRGTGLDDLAALTRLEEDLAARKSLLDARLEVERDDSARGALTRARDLVSRIGKRVAERRKILGGR